MRPNVVFEKNLLYKLGVARQIGGLTRVIGPAAQRKYIVPQSGRTEFFRGRRQNPMRLGLPFAVIDSTRILSDTDPET